MNPTNRPSAATFEPSLGTLIERVDSDESDASVTVELVRSDRLPYVAGISLSVMAGLIWLAASINAPPIVPFEKTDQPVRANLAQAPERAAALGSAAGKSPTDYWSEVGKAAGAF